MAAEFKWYRYRFGQGGNNASIPDPTQGGGNVSYQEGWGSDYELNRATEANAKAISRTQHNQLWGEVTGNVNYWQQHLYPDYVPAADNGGTAITYKFGTRVRYTSGVERIYEVINSAGTTALPTATADWVIVETAYPRYGTAGSQQRNNSENETLFQSPGDYVSTSNSNAASRGLLQLFAPGAPNNVSRTGGNANLFAVIGTDFGDGDGSTTFGLPPRAPVLGSVISIANAAYVIFGTYPASSPRGTAINTSNNDLWVVDRLTQTIYRRAGGTGAYTAVGTYPGSNPDTIDVNSINGDVFVSDATDDTIYKLTGGVGSWTAIGSYPGSSLAGVAVDDVREDVFAIDSGVGTSVYKLDGGTGTFQVFGTLELGSPQNIAVNSNSHDIFITDNGSDSVYRSVNGSPSFSVVGDYPGSFPRGVAASSENNGVWITDGSSDSVYFLNLDTQQYNLVGTYPGGDPVSIAASSDALYVTEDSGNLVYQATGVKSSPQINWYIKT